MNNSVAIDLKTVARRVMLENRFLPDFSSEIFAELQYLNRRAPLSPTKDLSSLAWSSIDNEESRDLDQAEWAEPLPNGDIRILIGIADVDCLVPKSSNCDQHAENNAVSVYAGVQTFPMLPENLSTDLTSLRQDQPRAAVVTEFVVSVAGDLHSESVYPAMIQNKSRLSYGSVGAWLQEKIASPSESGCSNDVCLQLKLQHEASERLVKFRKEQGALTLGGVETIPIFSNGTVQGFSLIEANPARDIIESFMVAANVVMARFLRAKGSLSLRRVVRTPKRWDRIQAIALERGTTLPDVPDPKPLSEFLAKMKLRDEQHFSELSLSILKALGSGEYIVEHPGTEHEGHFGLAVNDYTHSTAPNRRYADLVTQRLLKCAIHQQACVYSETELAQLARHCTERDQAARHVERFMKKVMAAALLSSRIGETFEGIVTGVTPKGTFARLLEIPAEGRIIRGEQGLDIGHKARVRLLGTDVGKGFIDFELLH